MATTIAWTSAMVGHGGTSNLQGFSAHHPLSYIGGGDSMVRTSLGIEREVDDTRSIRDMGVGAKRKENQSSSNSGKKHNDECLKHSYYTRVGFSFSRLFYSNFIVFCGQTPNLVFGLDAGALEQKGQLLEAFFEQ